MQLPLSSAFKQIDLLFLLPYTTGHEEKSVEIFTFLGIRPVVHTVPPASVLCDWRTIITSKNTQGIPRCEGLSYIFSRLAAVFCSVILVSTQ